MREAGRSRPMTCMAVLLAAILSTPVCSADRATEPRNSATYDCGTTALYTLLALEGRPTRLDQVKSRLPALDPRGYSLAQLRIAARACGLVVSGVRLPRNDRAPDRPALVFLEREGHGHFLVIRPVGHSGRLIQVMDSVGAPSVVDAAELHHSPEWTGLALIPARSDWSLRVSALVLAAAILSLFSLLIMSHRRGRATGEKQCPPVSDS